MKILNVTWMRLLMHISSERKLLILHPSTIIWRKRMKQGCRLKNYSERAKQQNEADRAAYMKALHLLVRNSNQVFLIDETHKDNKIISTPCGSRLWLL
jgi:hypothetical protein